MDGLIPYNRRQVVVAVKADMLKYSQDNSLLPLRRHKGLIVYKEHKALFHSSNLGSEVSWARRIDDLFCSYANQKEVFRNRSANG